MYSGTYYRGRKWDGGKRKGMVRGCVNIVSDGPKSYLATWHLI